MRINISLPDELLQKVDAKATSLNLSRSSYITMILTKEQEQLGLLETMQEILKNMSDTGE